MKKRLGRKLLSLIIVGMLLCNLPINVQAAGVITVDFNQFNTSGIFWCDSNGSYGDGTRPEDTVFYATSGGGYVCEGYSVALKNVRSNSGIGLEYMKGVYNRGTIVSTDGCIDYIFNYGTISGGTFKNVQMERGTIDGATVTSELRCESPSECIIKDVILQEGAEIKVYMNGEYEVVVSEPGTYTLNNGVVVESSKEESASEESTSGTDNSSNEDEKKEEPQEPKESEAQIFTRELLTRVATAKSGDTLTIDATLWHSFYVNILKELLSKEGVSYILYYNYGGECFYITIPAGAVLEEGYEWYGPLKLNAMFGRTMIDESELHAALNK